LQSAAASRNEGRLSLSGKKSAAEPEDFLRGIVLLDKQPQINADKTDIAKAKTNSDPFNLCSSVTDLVGYKHESRIFKS